MLRCPRGMEKGVAQLGSELRRHGGAESSGLPSRSHGKHDSKDHKRRASPIAARIDATRPVTRSTWSVPSVMAKADRVTTTRNIASSTPPTNDVIDSRTTETRCVRSKPRRGRSHGFVVPVSLDSIARLCRSGLEVEVALLAAGPIVDAVAPIDPTENRRPVFMSRSASVSSRQFSPVCCGVTGCRLSTTMVLT